MSLLAAEYGVEGAGLFGIPRQSCAEERGQQDAILTTKAKFERRDTQSGYSEWGQARLADHHAGLRSCATDTRYFRLRTGTSPRTPHCTTVDVLKLVVDCRKYHTPARRTPHGNVRLPIAVVQTRHRDVVDGPPLERHECREVGTRLLDVPHARRRSLDGEIGLAVAVVIARHRDVGRKAPLDRDGRR